LKKNKQSLVSIVIPTFNRGNCIGRAIQSVLNQTYINWEAIIIDNHSEDNTEDIVRQFQDSRIKSYKIHNNGVIAASRNLAIRNANGEFIAFLDSDDWWMPRKLEESIRYLDEGADVVYHDLYIVNSNNQSFYWRKTESYQLETPAFVDLIERGNALCNSSVVVRKLLVDNTGCLSEGCKVISWEDYDFWLRLAKQTERFVHIKKVLGYYWNVDKNKSLARINNLQNFKNTYLHNREATLPAWFQYEKGLNLLKNCRNIEAFPLLLEVLHSKICFRKKLISFLLIVYSGCNILLNKVQKLIL